MAAARAVKEAFMWLKQLSFDFGIPVGTA